jgi:hypothetical protein
MITDEEKINLIINRLNNMEAIIKSFIDNAESLKDKYVLEDELLICNAKKGILLSTLEDLGGHWAPSLLE